MAEERNLGVARAAESDDVDSTKAELQRRMEEARESITQTVTEIKDTVANQYQAVKDTVTEALDWREQYRKRPVVFTVGAVSAGFILGYAVAGTFAGDDAEDEDYDYPSYEESDAFATTGAEPARLSASSYEAESRVLRSAPAPSRGAGGYAKGAYGSTQYAAAPQDSSIAQSASETDVEEEDKPGLFERFKETRAYDKLQEEVGALGDRFIEELSKAGREIVLPALFGKVRDLFGVDLSGKQGGQQRQRLSSSGTGSSVASATGTAGAQGFSSAGTGSGAGSPASAGASGAASSSGKSGGASYATSENRSYTSPDRT